MILSWKISMWHIKYIYKVEIANHVMGIYFYHVLLVFQILVVGAKPANI